MQFHSAHYQGFFKTLMYNFRAATKRKPNTDEERELTELAKLLASPEQAIVNPKLTNFQVIRLAMDITVLELGMTDLDSKTEKWAGIFRFQNRFILAFTSDQHAILNVQLLGTDPSIVPILITQKTKDFFWQEFEWLYHNVLDL